MVVLEGVAVVDNFIRRGNQRFLSDPANPQVCAQRDRICTTQGLKVQLRDAS